MARDNSGAWASLPTHCPTVLRDANFFIHSLSIGGDIILSTVVLLEFPGLFLNFKSLPLWTRASLEILIMRPPRAGAKSNLTWWVEVLP